MYFPFPVSGKIFLYSILIFSAFWSMVHIKFHAVFPYQITKICRLMQVTVMVLLRVNTAASLCYSLFLLGCSADWAVDVVCDDARKPLWHIPPLAGVWYMIDKQLCQDQLCFFLYHIRTTLGLIGNSLWDMLWNQGQYYDGAVYQYIAMICHIFRPIFTRQVIIHKALQWSTLLSCSNVNDLYGPEDPF